MIKKKYLSIFTKSAEALKAKTKGTQVVFFIYSDNCFALGFEEDNIIDVIDTEEGAISSCNGINSGEFTDDGIKSDCYYKAALIDADTGERITRKSITKYLKPEFKHERF
jgi:hypothetical protein